MKYVCLVYQDESELQTRSAAEVDQSGWEEWAFTEVYRDGGQLVVEQWLQPACTAVTLRVTDGQVAIHAGPVAQARQQLRGYYLIQAGDRDEAVRVAAKMPGARQGSIEIRPVRD